jgi:sialic acid synthase SpsE
MASDLGTQYTLDLLERFQLSDDDLYRCFDHALARGLIPLCTPWDETSLEKLDRWGMAGFKVASADFTNHQLLSAIAATGKPLIASTGMATEQEIAAGIRHLRRQGAAFVLLHCNSTYPTPFKDVNLRYLQRLAELAEGPVGYSGHERGFAVPIAAVALGAAVMEKHITLDRAMEGNDHKVSLLPNEFIAMVSGIRAVEDSMGSEAARSLSQGELMNREVLAKSLVAACAIPAGVTVTREMVRIQSPGQGLQPYRLNDLLGKVLHSAKGEGECFFASDLDQPAAQPRPYRFAQRFGVPVRYHDLHSFSGASNLDLVEIHLSYKDVEVDIDAVLPTWVPMGLVVHAPELFAGDHTLDLCSHDADYRRRSVAELQRVIDLSERLRGRFDCPEPVLLVTNVGGFSSQRHLDPREREALLERLVESLAQLRCEGWRSSRRRCRPSPGTSAASAFTTCSWMPTRSKPSAAARPCGCAWMCPTPSWPATTCTPPSRCFWSASFPSPPTCTWPMRRAWMGRGCRSMRARWTGPASSGCWASWRPGPRSSRRSGRATRTMGKGPGSPWSGWSITNSQTRKSPSRFRWQHGERSNKT